MRYKYDEYIIAKLLLHRIAANMYCHHMVNYMKSTTFPYRLDNVTSIPRNDLCGLFEKHVFVHKIMNLVLYLVFHA